MHPKYKIEMDSRLTKAETLKEVLDILSEYYDLENCKPGPIVKASIVLGLSNVIKMTKAVPKKFYSDGNN